MHTNDDTTGRFSALDSINESFGESTHKEWLVHHSVFAALPHGSLHTLLNEAQHVRFTCKQELFAQGQTVRNFLILGAGSVWLSRPLDKLGVILALRGPGDCVGESALDAQYHHARECARALSDVDALALPMHTLQHMATQDLHVRAALFSVLNQNRLRAQTRLEALLHLDVAGRIAHVLLGTLARCGEAHPAGKLVHAPLTHAELASLIGSTRETVTLTLGRLRREGLIDFRRRRVLILDEDGLKDCLRPIEGR